MSIRWITEVWEGSPYKSERLLIHLALADFANDEGICWPSQRTLAHKARCTEGFVGVAIKQMITDGYLEIHRAAKGRGNPARYRLLNTRFANRVSEKPRSPAIETPFPDENTPYLGTVKEPSTLAADFEAFWKVYPRRIAKKEAQRVFAKVMAGREAPTLEELLEAVERYSSSQPDLKYVAYPATWLRQGRWADESGVVAPKPKRPDVELENAYGIIAPMAHLGKTWEECLRLLERYSDRVIEPCYAFYESIRRKYE